jgi:SNF2 family DNA or RNA helicase
MKVSTTQPFQVIYSLLDHELLGFLFEPFVVQVNSLNKLTLQHQSISSINAKEFETGMDEVDFKLITLIDAIQPEAIHKKFGDKKTKPNDFFLKIYDKNKGNEELRNLIENYVEKYKAQILELLVNKRVFEMGNDGEPTWREIIVEQEKATVLFHFYRNEVNTHYLPTIKHDGLKIEFQYKGARLICNRPAWMLCEGRLYHFEKDVEGNKLKPFLNKKFIEVPRKIEEEFFKKFGSQLIASFDVYAKGFEIKLDQSKPKPVLIFSELQTVNSTPSLFGGDDVDVMEEPEEGKMVFELQFHYGDYSFKADNPNPTLVRHEKTDDDFTFFKIKRDLDWEKEKLSFLKSIDFEVVNAKKVMNKGESFSWMAIHRDSLEGHDFHLKQNPKDNKRYFTGMSTISIEINENIDWFDIKAIIKFGDYKVPFYYLKNLILKKQKEFKLPNGEIAIIPDEWFTKYSELFAFMDGVDDDDDHKLKKHHVALVQELSEDSLAKVTMNRKLAQLRNFDHIEEYALPVDFKGTLRPYQHAGYNWMHFLNNYKFGGCLADDMGLGKTVQTLAFLLSQKNADPAIKNTSLLVVPTSLIYNWELEARKFAPTLKLHIYTGTNRDKNTEKFTKYDLIITSYGIARLDEELIKKFYFHYIILDESQAIKNPGSNTSKAVRNLGSRFKLILTGTPIENSTMDLWSQMTFINPGLLGSQSFFRDEFLNPIEKKGDEEKTRKLYSIIKPFILRRQKTQVAKDLPEKIESIRYCHMTEAQEKLYEETKSYFRNKILENETETKNGQKQIILLQGLTKLRQIANHPLMIDENYEGDSGKLEDVFYMMHEAIEGGHKVLVFSQFVKHLAIFRNYLEEKNITYSYLDGSSHDRQQQVEEFQKNDSIKIFLISLKAGGVGLNLTAADYVFILDPWWNPAVEAQAVDRAHRIGQSKTVFTYKFITKNSVEEKILVLQNKKKALAGDLISNEESFVKSLSKEDIEMILS